MAPNEIVHRAGGYVAVQRTPSGEVDRRLSRPETAWWCQQGPVNSCCCCFGLRTGEICSRSCAVEIYADVAQSAASVAHNISLPLL